MTLNLRKSETPELQPKLIVFGVGGAGGNAVNNMLSAELEGVEFIAANTDAQALASSRAVRKIQLGAGLTQGLGAGSKPDVGAAAAEASLPDILDALTGAHMVFITAGMGGGTGTGAAPVIARAAREMGILTVGVVTKPFHFEGPRRMRTAEDGLAELQRHVDTLIIIPNQNLFRVANEKTTFAQAFALADEVLHSGVRGITDLMVIPGLMNLDFADVRTVMSEMGKAMMGTGEAEGPKRANEAAEAAIANPLLDDVSMKGARGVLIHITGGMDLTLFEVDEAANRIRSECDPDANIKVGSTFDPRLEGRIRVSVVATGIDAIARPAAEAPGARKTAEPLGGKRSISMTGHRPAAPAPEPVAAQNAPAVPQNPVHALHEKLERVAPVAEPMAEEDDVLPLNTPARPQAPERLGRQSPLRRHIALEPRATATSGPAPDLLGLGPQAAADAPRAPLARPAPARPPLSASPVGEPEPKKSFRQTFFDRVTGRRGREADDDKTEGSTRAPLNPRTGRDESRSRPPEPDTLFSDPRGDDQLDIPAFLRRSAN